MILKLKAKHLKRTMYDSPENCAISKAIKELLPNSFVQMGISTLYVNQRHYDLSIPGGYTSKLFKEDKAKAKELGFGEETVRKISIPKLQIK